MKNFKKALLGATCASMLVAAPAGAATSVVGAAPIPDQLCGTNQLHWNTSAPYVIPAYGVVTQLSSFIGAAGAGGFPVTYSLKVLRPSTGQVVGTTATLVANNIGPAAVPASIAVQPGDVLGIWTGPAQFQCDRIAGAGDFGFEAPSVADPSVGPIPGFPGSAFSSRQYSVAATLLTPDLPPPLPAVYCVVPSLRGTTKSAAKTALEKANCKLGTTKKRKLKKFTKTQKKNRVRTQTIAASQVRPAGTVVDITINVKKPKKK